MCRKSRTEIYFSTRDCFKNIDTFFSYYILQCMVVFVRFLMISEVMIVKTVGIIHLRHYINPGHVQCNHLQLLEIIDNFWKLSITFENYR